MSGIPHLFQNFPQLIVIHTVKGFGTNLFGLISYFKNFWVFFAYSKLLREVDLLKDVEGRQEEKGTTEYKTVGWHH